MKWLTAGLTFVNAATVSALLCGMIGNGLNKAIAVTAVVIGLVAAILAYWQTYDPPTPEQARKKTTSSFAVAFARYRISGWVLVAIFAIFAFRAFCWILYFDGNELRVQSINNLGDLSLHLTYIKNFANGVAIWPDNPIYVFSQLRYPAGTDLFNGLLLRLGVGLIPGLVWAGLLACAATCYAFYRWGGRFGIAGFLFNGGLIGFQFLRTHQWLDYQGAGNIAWKSIPLTMLVTQRGLLYALPAGLILLYHWRMKYARPAPAVAGASPANERKEGKRLEESIPAERGPLPFWLELSLYASMPLFHAHTFLALSIVLAVLVLFSKRRREVIILLACAFIPAAFIAWLITDHFHAGSVLEFHAGWVQSDGEFAHPLARSLGSNGLVHFLEFWIVNFGFWIPIVLVLIAWLLLRTLGDAKHKSAGLVESRMFVLAAGLIFLLGFFVKTAPWGWDNIKIIVWSYFIVLPFIWSELLSRWPLVARALIYVALFGSGFVTLFGGMASGRPGYGIADRAEVDAVGMAVRKLPVEARFAAFPTYNHPLLLQGRKVVLGYPGHLWTQGFDYSPNNDKLTTLMKGDANWKETARFFQARYLFWGRQEKANYVTSKRPWEQESKLVASGTWGAIYDLEPSSPPEIRPSRKR